MAPFDSSSSESSSPEESVPLDSEYL